MYTIDFSQYFYLSYKKKSNNIYLLITIEQVKTFTIFNYNFDEFF